MLRTSLLRHPEIAADAEIFNPSDLSMTWISWPSKEVYDHVAFRYTHRKACGFIIHRDQGDDDVWQRLSGEANLKVLWLHRKNFLRLYLSHRIARMTGQWQIYGYDTVNEREPVTFEPEDFKERYHLYWKLYHQKRNYFKASQIHDIVYEDFVPNYETVMKGVLEFLEVAQIPLSPSTKKSENRPLSQIVDDYAFVKDWLRKNNFGHFLDEEDIKSS